MKDQNKDKQQLLNELAELQQQVAELTTRQQQRELAEETQVMQLLRTQRDLAVELGAISDLSEALNRLLEATFRVEGIDCAGIYLVSEHTGEINLLVHQGFPPQFVASAGHYDAASTQAGLLLAGAPVYSHYPDYSSRLPNDPRRQEDLRALVIIPVKHEGRVIASLNLASHTHDEILPAGRNVLECIAAQIGGVMSSCLRGPACG